MDPEVDRVDLSLCACRLPTVPAASHPCCHAAPTSAMAPRLSPKEILLLVAFVIFAFVIAVKKVIIQKAICVNI